VQRALQNLLTRTASRPDPQGLTLERYARAKQLPIDRLREWGCEDAQYQQIPAVRIPYRDSEGNLKAVRYRIALTGENRFRWRTGDKPTLYGLWRLPEWRDAEVVYLCEGESDTHTLWSAGLPALGVPGASVWQAEWWAFLQAFSRVVVIPDRDEAGQHLLRNLAITCPEALLQRVQVVSLPEGCKDVNALWIRERAERERFLQALDGFVQSCNALRDCTIAQLHESAQTPEDDATPTFAPLREILARAQNRTIAYLPLLGQDGLIARGTLTLLAAHPKAGKTTLLIHACREWLQQGLKVLYLTEEPLAVWQLRLQQYPELANLYLNEIPRAHPIRWAQSIRSHAPDVVIVDTVRRFCQIRDENDSASVSSALAPFVDLLNALPDTALVLAHHTRKNLSPEGEITDVAGSHAFTAEVDTVLFLTPCREHSRQRVLTPVASRLWAFTPEALVLELSEDGSCYRVKGLANEVLPEQREQDAKAQVLQALQELGEATAEEVREYLEELGCSLTKRWVRQLLQELSATGLVEREGTGAKSNPYRFRLRNKGIEEVLNSTSLIPQSVPQSAGIEEFGNCGTSLMDFPYSPIRNPFATRQELNPDPELDAILNTLTQGDFALEPNEIDALRIFWSFAQARGFPPLELPAYGYTLPAGRESYLNALYDLAGTDAIPLATRALQQRDSTGEPALTATQTQPADRGATPVQPTLM
jgi:DNA-binding transcriptional ArsR family regulator